MKKLVAPSTTLIVYSNRQAAGRPISKGFPVNFAPQTDPGPTIYIRFIATLKDGRIFEYLYPPVTDDFTTEQAQLISALNRFPLEGWTGSTGGFLFNNSFRSAVIIKRELPPP